MQKIFSYPVLQPKLLYKVRNGLLGATYHLIAALCSLLGGLRWKTEQKVWVCIYYWNRAVYLQWQAHTVWTNVTVNEWMNALNHNTFEANCDSHLKHNSDWHLCPYNKERSVSIYHTYLKEHPSLQTVHYQHNPNLNCALGKVTNDVMKIITISPLCEC